MAGYLGNANLSFKMTLVLGGGEGGGVQEEVVTMVTMTTC